MPFDGQGPYTVSDISDAGVTSNSPSSCPPAPSESCESLMSSTYFFGSLCHLRAFRQIRLRTDVLGCVSKMAFLFIAAIADVT